MEKCKNCEKEIAKFLDEWWHYNHEKEIVGGGFKQESHILFKTSFHPTLEHCRKAVPKSVIRKLRDMENTRLGE